MRGIHAFVAGIAAIATITSAYLWIELHGTRMSSEIANPLPRVSQVQIATPPHNVTPINTETKPEATPAQVEERPAQLGPRALRDIIPTSTRYRAELLKDPKYREAEFAKLRQSMAREYPDIAEELKLTSSQASALLDLLTNAELDKEGTQVPMLPGVRPSVAAVNEMVSARRSLQLGQEADLSEMLGDANYEKFKEYESGRIDRVQAHIYARQLESAGKPLDESQVLKFASAYVEQVKRNDQSDNRQSVEASETDVRTPASQQAKLDQEAEDNRQIIAAVQGSLTAAQLEVLGKILDQPLLQRRIELRIAQEKSGDKIQ